MLLTRATVAKLQIPEGRSDIVYWDDDLRGFGVRIRAGGKKSWVVVYRNAEGVQRKLTLSEVPITSVDQARAAAERALRSVGDQKDPHAEKLARRRTDKVESVLFGSLVIAYLKDARARLRPSSYDEVARHLEKLWLPLHRHPASRIDRKMIGEQLDKIAPERGLITANRARSSLSAMMAWAVERNKIDSNPVIGVAKPLKAEPKRDRVLTDEELTEVWKQAGDGHFGDAVRLLILTAARRSDCRSSCTFAARLIDHGGFVCERAAAIGLLLARGVYVGQGIVDHCGSLGAYLSGGRLHLRIRGRLSCWSLPEPHARAFAILRDEDHACRFEGGAQSVDRALPEDFTTLEARDGIRRHFRQVRQFAHPKPERHTRHLALNSQHSEPCYDLS